MPDARPASAIPRVRLALLGTLFLAGLLAIACRLWKLQVRTGAESWRSVQAKQSIRSVRLPGMRGSIRDRNGKVLAENRPSYCLDVYVEEFRAPGPAERTIERVMDTLYRLSERLGVPCTLSADDVRRHIRRRTPLPLTAWRDLPEGAIARYAETAEEFPGTALSVEPVRRYPLGRTASHLLGYVGRADLASEYDARKEAAGEEAFTEEKPHFYLPEMAGRAGVEKAFDGVLRAGDGGKLELQVDVAGFKFDEVSRREGGKGSDVRLAIDADAQAALERILSEPLPSENPAVKRKAAGVLIDPANGDVLAMASVPGFDPNDFVPAIPARTWRALADDPAKPLLNRAVSGEYAPGSTFKPVTLLAAMGTGAVRADTRFTCPGQFRLGKAVFHCWNHWGHGSIDLEHAIRYSCNVYLFSAALAAGAEAVQEEARSFGFGRKTGIALGGERAGLVPTDEWSRRTGRGSWRDGDTCNLSIGQGAMLVTPLQLALYAAALANGGTLWRPRLALAVVGTDGKERAIAPAKAEVQPKVSRKAMAAVRQGMKDVVNASDGTGKKAAVPGVAVAAKTGTAEYGRKGEGKKMTWMIAFAPYEKPRYAVAILEEDGVGGGSTCAPRVSALFSHLFGVSSAPRPPDAAEYGPFLPAPGEL
jgi:penicillin-binding protein 2